MLKPDTHDYAHYGIAAVLAGAVGYGGIALHNAPPAKAPIELTHFAAALSKIPNKAEVVIYCSPCDERATAIADAFDNAGWKSKMEPAIQAKPGVLITGQNEADAVKALGDDLGSGISGEESKDSNWMIAIGMPPHKEHAK